MTEQERWSAVAYELHLLTDHPDKTCGQVVCWWGPHHDEAVHYDGRLAHIQAMQKMLAHYPIPAEELPA